MDSNLSRGLMILKRQTLLRLPRALYFRSGASTRTTTAAIGFAGGSHNDRSGSADSVTLETNGGGDIGGGSGNSNGGGVGGVISSRRSFLLGRSPADDEQLLHSAAWSPGVQSIASGVSSVHRPSNTITSSQPSSPVNLNVQPSPRPRRLATGSGQQPFDRSSSSSTAAGRTRLSSWLLDSPTGSHQEATSYIGAGGSNSSRSRGADRRSNSDSDRSQMVTANSITRLPDDAYHAVYIGLLLCGVGFLLPYNCLVFASDYFQSKHPHSTIVFDLTLVYILSAFVAVCFCSAYVRWPSGIIRMRCGALLSLLTMFAVALMLLYDPLPDDEDDTSLPSSMERLEMWSLENVFPKTLHMATTMPANSANNVTSGLWTGNHSLHTRLDTFNESTHHSSPTHTPTTTTSSPSHTDLHHHSHQDHEHSPFAESPWQYRLTLFSAALMAVGCTVQQSSLYGVAAQLPQRYTHALMTGESAAGLIAALLRFLSRLLMRPVQANTLLFFCVCFQLVCVCLIVQLRIPRSRFYTAHVRQHEQLVGGAASVAGGASSLVNPIYEEGFLTITASSGVGEGGRTEPVPKSDSTEFELPFGIDEEELRIRLAHGWTGGEAARLGIRTLRRMKQRQEQRRQPDDLTDIFDIRDIAGREEDDDLEDDEDDEDELFALHLAPGHGRPAPPAPKLSPPPAVPPSATSIDDVERGCLDLLDQDDELVFDVGQTFPNRTKATINNSSHAASAAVAHTLQSRTEAATSPTSTNRSFMTGNNWLHGRLLRHFHFGFSCRLPAFDHRWQQIRLAWQQMWHTVNKRTQLCQRIWPHMVSIWLAYAVTLSLFPGIESEIINCDWLRWTPVLLMAIFNVTDLLGKLLASLCYRIDSKRLLWASIVRLLMIPLIVSCAGRQPKDSFWNRLPPLAPYLSGLLGVSNGILGSLPMIGAPSRVPIHQRQLTGNIMTFCYLFGLTIGSLFAYALRAWFVLPLQPGDLEHYCSVVMAAQPAQHLKTT